VVNKKIREQIESGGELPTEFSNLCEGNIDIENGTGEYEYDSVKVDQNIYFPKPFNKEQREIIYRLQSNKGVLVQGPRNWKISYYSKSYLSFSCHRKTDISNS